MAPLHTFLHLYLFKKIITQTLYKAKWKQAQWVQPTFTSLNPPCCFAWGCRVDEGHLPGHCIVINGSEHLGLVFKFLDENHFPIIPAEGKLREKEAFRLVQTQNMVRQIWRDTGPNQQMQLDCIRAALHLKCYLTLKKPQMMDNTSGPRCQDHNVCSERRTTWGEITNMMSAGGLGKHAVTFQLWWSEWEKDNMRWDYSRDVSAAIWKTHGDISVMVVGVSEGHHEVRLQSRCQWMDWENMQWHFSYGGRSEWRTSWGEITVEMSVDGLGKHAVTFQLWWSEWVKDNMRWDYSYDVSG